MAKVYEGVFFVNELLRGSFFIFVFSTYLNVQLVLVFCRCWDLNCGSQVTGANALPTEPQTLPYEVAFYHEKVWMWKVDQKYQKGTHTDKRSSKKIRKKMFTLHHQQIFLRIFFSKSAKPKGFFSPGALTSMDYESFI